MKPRAPTVEIRRTLACAPETAFELWMDEDAVGQWMCPNPAVRITDLDWDPHPGRAYRIVMALPDGPVTFQGRFLEVVPPRELAFTWVSPKTSDAETVVRVRLRPVPEGTALTLTHEGLPDPAAADEHRHGWEHILERLDETARAAEP